MLELSHYISMIDKARRKLTLTFKSTNRGPNTSLATAALDLHNVTYERSGMTQIVEVSGDVPGIGVMVSDSSAPESLSQGLPSELSAPMPPF